MKKSTSFMNKLYSIDFLSPKIGFEYRSSGNFNSKEGSLYSLFIIVLTAVVGGMFSKDFYFRQNPNAVVSQETIPISEVNLAEFPILIAFTLNNIITYDFRNFLDIDLVYFNVSPSANITRLVFTENIIKACNFTEYSFQNKLQEQAIKSSSSNMLCLNHLNLSFFNPYSEPNSAFINIRFKKCSNPGVGACPKNIDSLLQGITISIGFLDPYIDSKNYTDPVQYRTTFTTLGLSNGFLKRLFFSLRNDAFYSDEGWILEDVIFINYVSFQGVSTDYIINTDPLSSYYNHLYWTTFQSPVVRQRTNRSYMKVQELFATVGGFARFICIAVKFFTEGHLRFIYILFLRNLAINGNFGDLKGKV